MQNNAAKAVSHQLAEIKRLIALIEIDAEATAKDFEAKGGTDWGYVGSLTEANRLLTNCHDFLKVEG